MSSTSYALYGAWQSTDAQEGPLAAGMKPPRFLTLWSILGAIVGLVLIAQCVWAADHRNLEEGIPTAIEDAYTIAFRSFEQQTRLNYEDDGERGDIFRLEPELKWGVIKNGQLELRAPFFIGGGDREGSGDLELEGLYTLNVETVTLPATALRLGFAFPSGEDSEGVDTTVKGILTKGVQRARFHVNAGVTHVGAADSQEREFRYKVALGADHPLDFGLFPLATGLDNLVIADVFVEQSALEGQDPLWMGELGIRHQLNPWSVLAIGAGAGFSRAAPDYSLTIAYQYAFAGF